MNWFNSWRWMLDLTWLALLLVLLRHFWQNRKLLVQSKSWLKVKGHITHCEWTKVGHSVWPKIQYNYEVHDKELTGEYLFLDTSHNNPNSKYARNIAYKAAVAFKENSEIDVYYNPNQPDQSALDVTIPLKLNVILALISALILFHLGFIVFHLLV
ncbi:DUF3592 domain-containing protein [Legionella shakespearei]|uniref:DUF3592 domain-containing protein n=1 Tax=Legionella shakespearei DSM 23087 TaxID=1122169 RepID=A0A0W0Z024_9GAMM|nr:DUF3592 domain-containing protein [Legionella shakespearei]KTD62474.1 hypothetical protein Lsha_1174 [Legionella shakespearei DSM 23087]